MWNRRRRASLKLCPTATSSGSCCQLIRPGQLRRACAASLNPCRFSEKSGRSHDPAAERRAQVQNALRCSCCRVEQPVVADHGWYDMAVYDDEMPGAET